MDSGITQERIFIDKITKNIKWVLMCSLEKMAGSPFFHWETKV
jgi:hypothetical protein